MTGFLRRWGLIVLIACLLAAIVASGAWRLLTFEQLQRHHAELERFVRHSRLLSLATFFTAMVGVFCACIPGPGLMCVASGYLFGPLLGGLVSLAAAVTGSVVVFLACRSAFADWISRRGGPRVREVELALRRNAFGYLVTIKLIPMVPFFVPNIAAGLAGVRLPAVIAASVIGSAPVCFILASLGAGLGRVLDRGVTPDGRIFERPDVFLPLIGLSLLSVASVAWRLLRRGRSLPAPPR